MTSSEWHITNKQTKQIFIYFFFSKITGAISRPTEPWSTHLYSYECIFHAKSKIGMKIWFFPIIKIENFDLMFALQLPRGIKNRSISPTRSTHPHLFTQTIHSCVQPDFHACDLVNPAHIKYMLYIMFVVFCRECVCAICRFPFCYSKVDMPILTCIFFTLNWLTLISEMHFVKFHPEVASCLLSRDKRKYAPLGMSLLWKYIFYQLISHFLLYLQNCKEFEAEILDLQSEKYGLSFDIKKYTTSGWALGDENVIGIRAFKANFTHILWKWFSENTSIFDIKFY